MGPRLAAILVLIMGLTATASADPFGLFGAEDLLEQRSHVHKEVRSGLLSEGVPTTSVSDVACEDGLALEFPCQGVDLLSFTPLSGLRSGPIRGALGRGASDIWGWTDPDDGGEYVMMGKTDGTALFNITDPLAPIYLGDVPNPSPGQLIWHDIKVYENHAYIVSESVGHGVLILDLTRLRGVTEQQTWVPDSIYPIGFSIHNIAINEDTGFGYLVGGNNGIFAPDGCRSGLHMIDLAIPTVPVFAGCHAFGEGGGPSGLASYIHDTQCVLYNGPDERYEGRELCFNSSEDHMSIVDVTDKLNPVQIGLAEYDGTFYAHQGWLTDDGTHFMMGDELDEGELRDDDGALVNTRTLIFDVEDLENPAYVGPYIHETASIDHNMYVKDGLVYQSNYTAGLRILDTAPVAEARLDEVAFFDSFPRDDNATFDGTWSNYPYFASGTIAFTGIDEGLFLVRVHQDVLDEHAVPSTRRGGSDFGQERAAEARARAAERADARR